MNRFGSVEKALAVYNAGPQAVTRFGGIPPFPENRAMFDGCCRASGDLPVVVNNYVT